MSDNPRDNAEREAYLSAWRASSRDLLALLPGLAADDWALASECPGWTVHDVVAHVSAIEADLASGTAQAGLPADGEEISQAYTQEGVDARADHEPGRLIEELTAAVRTRDAALTSQPPDLRAPAWTLADGRPGWTWRTLLRNRVIDVWTHEQDVRHAVGLPGNLDTPGARLTAGVFAGALPMIVGRRVRPPVGTVVAVEVGDTQHLMVMGEGGRCAPTADGEPAVRLRMPLEAFIRLAAGRQPPERVEVGIDGDTALGAQILHALRLTP